MRLKRVCVFCGSSPGSLPDYAAAARDCGTVLAQRGLTLVYGGGNVGLMGLVADAALAAGGEVIGVIPRRMVARELAHGSLTTLIPVKTMHERKQRMADLADAFLALPGGIGTMEELFEAFTWLQLGLHRKPVGLLNVAGYYDSLLQFLAHMRGQRFLKPQHLDTLLVGQTTEDLLVRFAGFNHRPVGKWLDRQPREAGR
ncbi:MAG TPA: TIGR00730 family Rossman fold protein [Candidatus Acidoferrum sp.]|nr:TIGR00730 family Rossman fold protein [Candidatus Acidoferrum sp.]